MASFGSPFIRLFMISTNMLKYFGGALSSMDAEVAFSNDTFATNVAIPPIQHGDG